MSDIRHLEAEIKKNGFTYRLLVSSQAAYIYGQHLTPEAENPHCFEVFKKRVVSPHPQDPDQSPKEAFPGSSDFGKWAWNYRTLPEAIQKQKVLDQLRETSKTPAFGLHEAEKPTISHALQSASQEGG